MGPAPHPEIWQLQELSPLAPHPPFPLSVIRRGGGREAGGEVYGSANVATRNTAICERVRSLPGQ
jgi:hypothetical protein